MVLGHGRRLESQWCKSDGLGRGVSIQQLFTNCKICRSSNILYATSNTKRVHGNSCYSRTATIRHITIG